MSTQQLPQPKKPVKYTPASYRIMQVCDKAFNEHRFVLLYFTNRKLFNPMFNDPNFKNVIKANYVFVQLSRADKAGNWLTTTYHCQSSPYYAIIDPSTGNFITIHYGDMTIEELGKWLSTFSGKFNSPTCIFKALLEEHQEFKRKTAFSYGTKLRITFVCSNFEDKILYINKSAPLEFAFEKYCQEQSINRDYYYFLFRGIELPPDMTATHFGLRNGSVIHVHPLDDRTSKEKISIKVVGLDNNSSVFNVEKGKKIKQFLQNYCETNQIDPQTVRFTFHNDVINDDLTFAEHNMKNDDQIYAHLKTFSQPPEILYRMYKPNEMPSMIPSNDAYDVQMAQMQMQMPMAQLTPPNMMYMPFNQRQQQISMQPQMTAPLTGLGIPPNLPPSIPPITPSIPLQQIPGQMPNQMPQYNQYPMPPTKVYSYSKPVDQNQNQTMGWENFDMQ